MTETDSAKLENHDIVLFGRNGDPGIAHQVKFMWRAHVWIISLISAAAGFGFHWVIEHFGKL